MAKGCEEELRRFSDMKVYQYVEKDNVPEEANIISVKWVHVNKGTPDKPNVRCRLVAQEFNDGSQKDELFAGTPRST